MKFCITGVNHRTAPVEVRERLAFDAANLSAALDDLKGRPGVLEGMILSTCNRVEIALATDDGAEAATCADDFIAENRHVEREWMSPYLYRFADREAIHHLFRVASSLDSMVVGEPQILGQLKAAWSLAREQGAISGFLDTLLTRAFSVAKRVRTETDIGSSAVSVSFAAVELAREIFGNLKNTTVMVIGAGKMAEAAARHLRRCGAPRLLVTNRTRERAVEMARQWDGEVIDYEKYPAALPQVDIVITSSGAPHFILNREQMKKVVDVRKNRPVFLIDIAVPRNVDPEVNKVENVFLYDIDDLQRVVNSNVEHRQKVASEAEQIIQEEVERMLVRLRAREVAPTIVSLQEQLEAMRTAEVARMKGRFGALTPQQEEALEALTRGLMNKIAHGPISELRRHASEPDGEQLLNAVRRVFRLGA
jgi:glutamyl-tRNA reductase